MPVTPLTTECRAIASRMRNVTGICGNIGMQWQLVYKDPDILQGLHDALIAASKPTEAADVTTAQIQCSNLMECEGNIALHPIIIESATFVDAGCALIEALP